MSAIVEMYRDAAEPGGRDRFSCSAPLWELLQEIGQTFGWHPIGATYVVPPELKIEAPAHRDYRPGPALHQKRIEHGDAAAWARSLERANDSSHLAAMITARIAVMSAADAEAAAAALLPGVVKEFVEFSYGGAFIFFLSPDSEP